MSYTDLLQASSPQRSSWIIRGVLLACVVGMSFAVSACASKDEPNPIPIPAQEAIHTPTKAVEPARGDQYINALKAEERTAAAAVAESYIKEKTHNRLDRLVLNPSSEYWEFPEDLNEFNKVGYIITFDAYVDGNDKKPYRIVLVRGNTSSKEWEVKRFRPDNKSLHS